MGLDLLSEQFGISVNQLSRFSNGSGCTFIQYITMLRMDKERGLLMNTDIPGKRYRCTGSAILTRQTSCGNLKATRNYPGHYQEKMRKKGALRKSKNAGIKRKKRMQKEMEKRPNILLITTDTQEWIRCAAWAILRGECRRILDELAEEGILFERAYTAAPACMPARCCLMTGLYSPLHGCIENGIERQEQLPMLTDELKKRGL